MHHQRWFEFIPSVVSKIVGIQVGAVTISSEFTSCRRYTHLEGPLGGTYIPLIDLSSFAISHLEHQCTHLILWMGMHVSWHRNLSCCYKPSTCDMISPYYDSHVRYYNQQNIVPLSSQYGRWYIRYNSSNQTILDYIFSSVAIPSSPCSNIVSHCMQNWVK